MVAEKVAWCECILSRTQNVDEFESVRAITIFLASALALQFSNASAALESKLPHPLRIQVSVLQPDHLLEFIEHVLEEVATSDRTPKEYRPRYGTRGIVVRYLHSAECATTAPRIIGVDSSYIAEA